MTGLNRRPVHYKYTALPTELMEQEQVSFFNLKMIFFCLLLETLDTNAGIRTQEALRTRA